MERYWIYLMFETLACENIKYNFKNIYYNDIEVKISTHPACDVVATSHLGRDVAVHAKTWSQRRNWYVNETDLFETSHWYVNTTDPFETM